jgi:hypothetical protein
LDTRITGTPELPERPIGFSLLMGLPLEGYEHGGCTKTSFYANPLSPGLAYKEAADLWKKILAGVAVLLLILVALAWYLLAHLGLTIQASIEKNAAAATGTRVAIRRVEVSLFTGTCIISGLTVSNPPGFNTPYALSLGTITVHATTANLLEAILAASKLYRPGHPIVVDEMNIDRPHIHYQLDLGGRPISLTSLGLGSSNLAILQHDTQVRSAAAPPTGPSPKEIVKDVTITNGGISISTSLIKGPHLVEKLAPIHLTGIGATTGGVTTGELCEEVLTAITSQSTITGAASLVKAVGSAVTHPIIDKLKSLV